MNIEEFRDFCMALDGVAEKTPFGKFSPRFDSTLVFYVCGHMFSMVDMDDFTSVSFRSTPEEMEDIRSHYTSARDPLNPAMKYWVSVMLDGDMPDNVIYSLVRRAYGLIRDKYTIRRK